MPRCKGGNNAGHLFRASPLWDQETVAVLYHRPASNRLSSADSPACPERPNSQARPAYLPLIHVQNDGPLGVGKLS